ncbi:MAG: DUF6263 family protein [Phycisphaerales bacterium]|jgi:hypothetical protein|nr:DUF6263 family protein [Phycisphaerales bacterium]
MMNPSVRASRFRSLPPVALVALSLMCARPIASAGERGVPGASVPTQPSRSTGVVLKWTWAEGDARRYEVEESMTERADDTTKRSGRTITYAQRVTSVDASGVATVEQTFERVRAWLEEDGTRVDYPRDPKAREHPGIAPYAALEGGRFTFQVDVEGKVLRVDGLDELLRRAFAELGNDPNGGAGNAPGMPDLQSMVLGESGVLTPEAMREWVEQGLRVVPGREVRRGESWRVEASQDLPFVGSIDTGRTFTLSRLQRGKDGQIATIEMESGESASRRNAPAKRSTPRRSPGTGRQPAPDPNDPAAMLDEMGMSFTLVERSMTGTFRFDTGAGQVESGSTRQVMEWEVRMPDLEALLNPDARNNRGGGGGGDSVMRYRIEQDSRLRMLGPGA